MNLSSLLSKDWRPLNRIDRDRAERLAELFRHTPPFRTSARSVGCKRVSLTHTPRMRSARSLVEKASNLKGFSHALPSC
jgi:hypothetical protein